MSKENENPPAHRPSLLRNWISLTGVVVIIGGVFSIFLLLVLDAVAHFSNPYISILTYVVVPAFLLLGALLVVIGMLYERRRRAKTSDWLVAVQIDPARPRDRRIMITFVAGGVCFLLVAAVSSYKAFNFNESVQFCGETCHGVMRSEEHTSELQS